MPDVLEYLHAAALVGLHSSVNDLPNGYRSKESIAKFIANSMTLDEPTKNFDELLPILVREEILDVVSDEVAGDFYRLDRQQVIQRYASLENARGTVGGRMAIVGLQLLRHALENFEDEQESVERPMLEIAPAANRIVAFDHNSQATLDLVEATEEASELIRASNAIEEDKRSWIRAHIQAGLDFIKTHRKMLVGAAAFLLLEPLKAAYEAVSEEPAKAAILIAINAVRTFFGI